MSDNNKDLLRPDNIGKDVKRLNNRPLIILGSISLIVLLILSYFIFRTPNNNSSQDKDITVSSASINDSTTNNNADMKFVEDLASSIPGNNNSILNQAEYATKIPGLNDNVTDNNSDNTTKNISDLKKEYEKMNLPPIPVSSDESSSYVVISRGGKEEIPPELLKTKSSKNFTAFEDALKARTLVYEEKATSNNAKANVKKISDVDDSISNLSFDEYYKREMEASNKIISDITGQQGNKNETTTLYDSNWLLNSKVEASDSLMIRAGSIIPGTLISGINSDLAGQVIAQVRQNVYDTQTGDNLLIPQGSKLVGEYISDITYGQNRIFMVWKRITFPNGEALDLLDGMPAADIAGYAGLEDKVNHHLVRIFGSAILMSGVIAGIEFSQQSVTSNSGLLAQNAGSSLSAALGQSLGETMKNMIEKNMSISPTIEIRPGYLFNLMVIKDMKFDKPYIMYHNK